MVPWLSKQTEDGGLRPSLTSYNANISAVDKYVYTQYVMTN